jgi:hypothetical protein
VVSGDERQPGPLVLDLGLSGFVPKASGATPLDAIQVAQRRRVPAGFALNQQMRPPTGGRTPASAPAAVVDPARSPT